MPHKPKTLSISHLAKYGDFDELLRRISAGEQADLAILFQLAVTDFRTVRRNPGHFKILQWCLDQGLDFDARGGWLNQSMICLAAAAGNNEIVRDMLRRKPPTNPFVWASLGEVEWLKSHASGHELSTLRDENGFNLLFYCAQSGLGRRDEQMKQQLTETCRLLLDQDVSPTHEAQYDLVISPAFLCAAHGGNAEIMRLLLERGAMPAERLGGILEFSLEPHQRSGEPFYDVAHCILQHGYDINQFRADQNRSLLHGAANRGTIKAVKWLIENRADPNRLDAEGRTPLHVCARRNASTTVIKLLIDAGANPNARDHSGRSALDYARENKRAKVAQYLESLGCR